MRNSRAALMREYNKELNKVLKRITKLQSEGYIIHGRNIPKVKSGEKFNVKREIERLKKYKESYIKNLRTTKYKTREGKIVKGSKGAEIQRSEAAKKGWRERREKQRRERMIPLGEALLAAIREEIDQGMMQIPMIKDNERKDGYYSRCLMIRGTLDTEMQNNPANLFERLGAVNNTVAVSYTQIACRYDVGASEDEAWNAALQLIQILRGSNLAMNELKEIEGMDTYEYFEGYYAKDEDEY